MEKTRIKEILRESLPFQKLESAKPAEPKKQAAPAQEPSKKQAPNHNYEKDYSEVQTKLQDTMLKQSQVMAAAGLGDPTDATDRSLFSKKVRKDKNDQGGQYLFNDKELASVIKVLNNPAAYLNVKSVKK